jgi:hypothetical protein
MNEWYSRVTLYPDYTFLYFTEKESRAFLAEHYDLETLTLFDSIHDISILKKYMAYAYLSIHPGYHELPEDLHYIDSTDTFLSFVEEIKTENKYMYPALLECNGYQFYREPSIYPDTFSISHIQNQLYYIKRTDDPDRGWGQFIRLKVVSPISVQRIDIGTSTENEKVFKIEE